MTASNSMADKIAGTLESSSHGPGTLSNGTYKDGKSQLHSRFCQRYDIPSNSPARSRYVKNSRAKIRQTEGMTGTWAATKIHERNWQGKN
jgi:hypothetical protein